MKLGITTEELSLQFNEFEAVKHYASIGYKSLEYSFDTHAYRGSIYDKDNYLEYAYKLREVADRVGIVFNQMHAPLFHTRIDVEYEQSVKLNDLFLEKMTCRGFEIAAILGVKYIVMHPRKMENYNSVFSKQKTKEYNLKMFKEYEKYAKKYNVKIALENMFVLDKKTGIAIPTIFSTAEEIVSFIQDLKSDYFVACLDTGHANINGIDPSYMVEILGDYLKVLHVNDNNAREDQHLVCGFGTIDWNRFIKKLEEYKYDGVFSLETMNMCTKIPTSSCLPCVKFEYNIIKNLTYTV